MFTETPDSLLFITPVDTDAERLTLAGALADPLMFLTCKLTPEDFYDVSHRALWRVMQRMRADPRGWNVQQLVDMIGRLPSIEQRTTGKQALDTISAILGTDFQIERSVEAAEKVAKFSALRDAQREAINGLKQIREKKEVPVWFQSPTGKTRLGAPLLLGISSVKSSRVSWLWPRRIPRYKVTVIAGDPGLGKSYLTIDLTARVTNGGPWPQTKGCPTKAGTLQPGSVVMLSMEDDPSDTIRPRLEAAGANLERVSLLTTVKRPGGKIAPFDLTRDIPLLEAAIKKMDNCRLVVIDPITAYLGESDMRNHTQIRAILTALNELAVREMISIIAVSHLNKSTTGPALYRTMGSLAFVSAPRAVWLVTKDEREGTEEGGLGTGEGRSERGVLRTGVGEDRREPTGCAASAPAPSPLGGEGRGEGSEAETTSHDLNALSEDPNPQSEIPNPQSPHRRLFLPIKNNLTSGIDGLSFEIREGRVVWSEEGIEDIDQLTKPRRAPNPHEEHRRQACAFLKESLKDGPQPSSDLIRRGREQGLSERTMRQAFQQLGGQSFRGPGRGAYQWRINEPQSSTPISEAPPTDPI